MSNKIDNDQRKEGSVGLYIHWPFCLSKCPYCDFNVHVRAAVDHDAWAAAYVGALSYYAGMVPDRRVESIYFGGGTPSLMSPATVESIIATVRDLWPCADDLDVTLEANPTSVERDRFRDFAAAGVNRLSLGVQALNDADLAFLGRKHSAAEAINALEVAKSAFDRVSFDLIYARPGQSLQDWEGELRRAAALAGGHLSLYQLTIERSTPFYYDHAQGKFHIPDDDLAADFYTLTQDVLDQAGLPAYEVSNHAAAGSESRHNLIYWHYRDYIGIGPGAHGRLTLDGQKHAMRDHHAPEIWLDRVAAQGHGAHPYDVLSEKDQVFEAVMMGLRLRSGMIITPEMRRYLNAAHMKVLQGQGWMEVSGDHMRLTVEGMLRLNRVVPYVLEEARPDLADAV